jgi:hypothetical protein
MGFGYVRADGGSQLDVPTIDLGYGLTNRVQVGATVPFYHSTYADTTVRGLDDVYLSAKFTAIDPASNKLRAGLAVSPVIEVLSAGSVDGRLHWALPVSVEVRRDKFRVYGSGGYFSRGALFSGGAIEWAAGERIAVTGALTQSYSTKEDPASDAAGIGRHRIDATGGVGYAIGNAVSVYASVGRSLTSIAEGGTPFVLGGGISIAFASRSATP